MSQICSQILTVSVIGIGATLCMDLWNLFLKQAFGLASLNYCLFGRWLRHMPGGTFCHASIAAASAKRGECWVGRLAHYAIGVILAQVFVLLVSRAWLLHPTLPAAVIYGIGTVAFPLFVMQPALGLGIASAKTPKPRQARLKSLATHTIFGLGLYFCALIVRNIQQS
jgi:hypothetical protein